MKTWKFNALSLHHDGLSVRCISDKLGIPKSTVHDLLSSCHSKKGIGAKVLLYDIETSPILAYVWSRWKQNIHQPQVVSESVVLTWSAKWLGSDSIMSSSNLDYGPDPLDDFGCCEALWNLFDNADIVVAHNGDRFDVKRLNSRWLIHGFNEPSSYRSVDTLKILRRKFGFSSNRLGDIGEFLSCGSKLSHGGFKLWIDCMSGDKDSIKQMVAYNERDVLLLEEIYIKLRGWDHLHPNLNMYTDNDRLYCSVCSSGNLVSTGSSVYTQTGQYKTYRCGDCGKINRVRTTSKTRAQGRKILVPAK